MTTRYFVPIPISPLMYWISLFLLLFKVSATSHYHLRVDEMPILSSGSPTLHDHSIKECILLPSMYDTLGSNQRRIVLPCTSSPKPA